MDDDCCNLQMHELRNFIRQEFHTGHAPQMCQIDDPVLMIADVSLE
jgi:hypothetical protein